MGQWTGQRLSYKLVALPVVVIINCCKLRGYLICGYIKCNTQLGKIRIVIPKLSVDEAKQHDRIIWNIHFKLSFFMMLGVYDACGLLRAVHSHNSAYYKTTFLRSVIILSEITDI